MTPSQRMARDKYAAVGNALRALDVLPDAPAGNVFYVEKTHTPYDDESELKQSVAYYPHVSHRKQGVLNVGSSERIPLFDIPPGSINYSIYDQLFEYGYRVNRDDAVFTATSVYKYIKNNTGVYRNFEISSHLLLAQGAVSIELGHVGCGTAIEKHVRHKSRVIELESAFNTLDNDDIARVDTAVAWLIESVLR